MLNKLIKVILLFVLVLGIGSYNADIADAATKVMWGKTELKVGQIGKVTILNNTPLVKLASDGSLTTVRMLNKGNEFRVYQYKGQSGGLYGVGASSFVQKNDVKVLYETPSKAKLNEVSGKASATPTTPVTSKPAEPDTASKAETAFKNTLGSSYTIKAESGIVAASVNGNNLFIYNKEDKNYMLIKDVSKSSDGYKIMKSLGLSITETEFNNMISKSKKNKDTIQKGTVEVYATNSDIDISW